MGTLLSDLKRAYPRETITGDRLALYHRELVDLPPAVLAQAVSVVIRTSRYFPTVAELRAAAAEFALGLPTEADALAQVEARIRWARDQEGEPPPVHPLAASTLKLVGGYAAFRDADQPAVVRGQWLRLFREERARLLRSHAEGPPALPSGREARALGA